MTPTDYRYTSQLSQVEIGLYYYNARWYDPALGRFVQADTIIPQADAPIAYDRYAYVAGNPINHTDPTGHFCDEEGNCYDSQGWHAAQGYNFTNKYIYKKKIWVNYGIRMSDNGDKAWDEANLKLMNDSLSIFNKALNNKLRSMVAGATYKLMEHVGDKGVFNGTTNKKICQRVVISIL